MRRYSEDGSCAIVFRVELFDRYVERRPVVRPHLACDQLDRRINRHRLELYGRQRDITHLGCGQHDVDIAGRVSDRRHIFRDRAAGKLQIDNRRRLSVSRFLPPRLGTMPKGDTGQYNEKRAKATIHSRFSAHKLTIFRKHTHHP